MLYTRIQNKRLWEDACYAYNLVRMVLKLSELHCNEPGIRGTSVFLAGHSVAMVTYCVTKIIPTCLPVTGQIFDTMIVASSDNEW